MILKTDVADEVIAGHLFLPSCRRLRSRRSDRHTTAPRFLESLELN
jgi:hypothetical protein